jgi:hypothetical protein
MTMRPTRLLSSTAAVLAVLGGARAAHAGECAVDDDCGHGFECETWSSGTGGSGGTSGSGASVGGASVGGASAAGTSGFAPPREVTCGDGLCQSSETLETCALDCANTVCVLAACESTDDCAEGYECVEEPLGGTGGAAGAACGDGLCTSGETAETCAVDCTATRRCAPAGGVCSSDAQCADGFYCSFVGSGAGGSSASGSGGFAGTSGSSSGGAAPAAGGASSGGGSVGGSSSGGTTSGTGSGDAALAAGTCMPREDGTGGTTGSGGSTGSGGAFPGTGGVGAGGSGFAGSGFGGSGATTGGASGSAGTATGGGGTGGGGTSSGGTSGATGGSTGGSSGSGGNATGGTGMGTGGTAEDEDPGSAERGGCAIAVPRGRSSFAELGAFLLVALSVLARRRRA